MMPGAAASSAGLTAAEMFGQASYHAVGWVLCSSNNNSKIIVIGEPTKGSQSYRESEMKKAFNLKGYRR